MAIRDPLTKINNDLPNVGGDSGAWGTILNKILGGDGAGGDPTGVDKWIEDLDSLKAPKDAPTFTGAVTFSGVQTAAAQPRARVDRTANKTIATGSATVLDFDREIIDIGTLHDPTTNNSRITVPAGGGGLWDIRAHVTWDVTQAAPEARIEILKNGTTVIGRAAHGDVSASSLTTQAVALLDEGVATDFYEVRVFQNSGADGTVIFSSTLRESFFEAVKLA